MRSGERCARGHVGAPQDVERTAALAPEAGRGRQAAPLAARHSHARGACAWRSPQTSETASWGHPNFRAGKKTFCAFEMVGGRPSIALRLSPTDVDLTLRRKQFFATPYGRGLWASVWVDAAIDWK